MSPALRVSNSGFMAGAMAPTSPRWGSTSPADSSECDIGNTTSHCFMVSVSVSPMPTRKPAF